MLIWIRSKYTTRTAITRENRRRIPLFLRPDINNHQSVMAELAVNIDHVATLREARGGREPDPVSAAVMAELYGAVGIVCHLREDRRHVNDRDLRLLREVVQTKLDLEMGASEELISIALQTLPDLVTIVPENRDELTTEGGLNVAADVERYRELVYQMHERDIEVSFFIDPVDEQIEAVLQTEADIIELHTGAYANARTAQDVEQCLVDVVRASEVAHESGLRVTAGHGLNYVNVGAIVTIPQIVEVSIGHAIMARAIYVGLKDAIQEMVLKVRG